MSARIWRRPKAWDDLAAAALYIGRDSLHSAERFLDAAEATLERLAQFPLSAGRYPTVDRRLSGIRVAPIRGFPNHLVFYLPREDGIEVVRIIHGARDLDAVLDET